MWLQVASYLIAPNFLMGVKLVELLWTWREINAYLHVQTTKC